MRTPCCPRAPSLRATSLVAAWLLLLAPFSTGQNAQHSLSLAGSIELARLVDLASQRLGLTIEYDARQMTGTVTLRIDDEISDDELWTLTNRLLASHGLTTVRMAGSDTLSVAKIEEAAGIAAVDHADIASDLPASGFVTTAIQLRHRQPDDVLTAIQPLISKRGGSATRVGDTGMLLVSDLTPRVAQVLELIERIDGPADRSVIRFRALTHSTGERIATLVQQIRATDDTGVPRLGDVVATLDGGRVMIVAPEHAQSSWIDLLDRLDDAEPVITRTYVPQYFGVREVAGLIEQISEKQGPDSSTRVVIDELTGSLIVTGTPDAHDRIASLITRLDEVPGSARRPVRSYVLRNRGVQEVIAVLQDLVEAGAVSAEEDRQPDDQGTNEPTGDGNPDSGLSLTSDEATNTIIAVGEPRMLDQLGDLIHRLDVRQSQVMLEMLVVSLSDGETLDLGIELDRLIRSGDLMLRLSSLFGLSGIGASSTSIDSAGTGGSATVLDPGDFSVVVRALETLNEGRSLSMPKVLANNNQQATIDSVVQAPFLTTNASDTVATTSFGGTQDAGTTMSITPQIAEGDHLVLEYSISISTFVGESTDPSLPPPRQQNSVQSVVTIPDGFTVAVGGIELITEAEAINQVPLLGSIPLIGELFKSRSNSETRSRFFVFIRANVLRDNNFNDLKYLSAPALDIAGIDDGWPSVQPRLIR